MNQCGQVRACIHLLPLSKSLMSLSDLNRDSNIMTYPSSEKCLIETLSQVILIKSFNYCMFYGNVSVTLKVLGTICYKLQWLAIAFE